MMPSDRLGGPVDSTAPTAVRPALRRIRAAALLAGAREVIIELDMETEYRLRLTKAGKLILTK